MKNHVMNYKNKKAMEAIERLRFTPKFLKTEKIFKVLFVVGACIFFISLYFMYLKKMKEVSFMFFLASVLMLPGRFFDFLRARGTIIAPIILTSSLSLVLVALGFAIFFFRR